MKNVLGQVLLDATTDLVLIEKHGKSGVAAMPADDAHLGILCAYASGHMTRIRAMHMLGFTWYGQLKDALLEANVDMSVDAARHSSMVQDAVHLLGLKR